jgi:hypothetical protein
VKYDSKDFDKFLDEHIEKTDPTHPMRLLARKFIRERGAFLLRDIEDILFDFGRMVEKQ